MKVGVYAGSTGKAITPAICSIFQSRDRSGVFRYIVAQRFEERQT
jgi:hypothetical protein